MAAAGGPSSPEHERLAAEKNNAVYAEMAAAGVGQNSAAGSYVPDSPRAGYVPESPPHTGMYMAGQVPSHPYHVYVPATPPMEQVLGMERPAGAVSAASSPWREEAGGEGRALGLHLRAESFQSERSLFSETASMASERSMENVMVTGSHSKKQLVLAGSPVKMGERKFMNSPDAKITCAICDELVGVDHEGHEFVPCECAFPVCRPCYEYIRKNEGNRCPRCKEQYKRKKGSPRIDGDPEEEEMEEEAPTPVPMNVNPRSSGEGMRLTVADPVWQQAAMRLTLEDPVRKQGDGLRSYLENSHIIPAQNMPQSASHNLHLSTDVLDPTKRREDYGYGSIVWLGGNQGSRGVGAQRGGNGGGGGDSELGSQDGGDGGGGNPKDFPSVDNARRPLSRKVPVSPTLINPYRFVVVLRFVVMCAFLSWRILNPNHSAYGLWLTSVICEIWFGFSWILDQFPKWSPITRETFLDRLALRYDRAGEPSELALIDVFVSTADPEKEPPLVTSNVLLSILAADYPVDKIACYLSDDGAAMLTFEMLTETASFARFWVPFCKKFEIEPRAPEIYFQQHKSDYLKDKVHADFVRERRQMKREYEEFKVRINALVAKSANKPRDGWKMADGTPWPGNNKRDHVGMIQVFLQPDGDATDVEGNPLPRLVYVSREKRPGYDHNKKAGAMNALVRASALITNAPYILNLDCDHYVNYSKAFREAMCFMMDPLKGSQVCYVQFPQRFDGVDTNDRYANHNTVFYDVTCKALDGVQGPMYVGTGCCFRRQALYGYSPPAKEANKKKLKEKSSGCFSICCGPRKPKKAAKKKKDSSQSLMAAVEPDSAETHLVPTKWHAKRFGVCHNFVATTFEVEGGTPNMSPRTVLSDVILVISCGYEDNTEWGKEIGWIYGSVTEDIVTGFFMHCRGWRSVYALTERPAFKGTAPINLTDRLHQVLRWGLGSVEIFFSRHNPLWYGYNGGLKFVERVSYVNTTIYPFTSIFLFVYCALPAICLLTNQFIISTITNTAVILFLFFFLTIFVLAALEIRWSGVPLDEFWRNEQFWLIGGVSSHLAAVWQGLLKVLAGFDSQFTLTQKDSGDEGEYAELYTFKWTWLIIPPTTIIILNILGIVAGISRAFNQSNPNWGQLFGKLFFAIWVLLHLYPFAKGLMGRHNRAPTIVIVWSGLLAISLSLLWVRLLG